MRTLKISLLCLSIVLLLTSGNCSRKEIIRNELKNLDEQIKKEFLLDGQVYNHYSEEELLKKDSIYLPLYYQSLEAVSKSAIVNGRRRVSAEVEELLRKSQKARMYVRIYRPELIFKNEYDIALLEEMKAGYEQQLATLRGDDEEKKNDVIGHNKNGHDHFLFLSIRAINVRIQELKKLGEEKVQ